MHWNNWIQNLLMIPLTQMAIAILVFVYSSWWIPTKFTIFIFMMVVIGLFAVHALQRQYKKSKEMTLVTTVMIYLVLIVLLAIREVWRWGDYLQKDNDAN